MSRNGKIKIINKSQDQFIIKYFYLERYIVLLILSAFFICPALGIAAAVITSYGFLFHLFSVISLIIVLGQGLNEYLSYETISLSFNKIEIKKSLCGIDYFSQKIKFENFNNCYISTREPIYRWTPKKMSDQYRWFSKYLLRIVKIEIKKEKNEKYLYETIRWRYIDAYLTEDAKWILGEGQIKIISWGFRISESDAQIVVDLINDFVQKHKRNCLRTKMQADYID